MKAIIIVAIICVTLIIIAAIGANTTNETGKRLDTIENALRREDKEIAKLWETATRLTDERELNHVIHQIERVIDVDKMWQNIAEIIAESDKSFDSFIYRHSKALQWLIKDNVLIIGIEEHRLDIANTKLELIKEIAYDLYETDVYLRPIPRKAKEKE